MTQGSALPLAIVEDLNSGLDFASIIAGLHERLRPEIPCNRLAVALYEKTTDRLSLHVCRSDGPMLLREGYSASLKGSSLERLLAGGEPRIINDLEEHLRRKPESSSTALIVREGLRSSLSLPLIARGKPIGVLFLSSRVPNSYTAAHAALMRMVAGPISAALERSLLIEELRTSRESLARSETLAAVGELAATVAHEIKNPLAGISGAIQVIVESIPAGDSRREIVSEILAQVRRLDETVRDLLVFAKPWNPDLQKTDIVEVIDRASAQIGRERTRIGIQVRRETPSSLEVDADPRQLEEVLLNLLHNAADAMPRGGCIRVVGSHENSHVVIRVIDSGIGITAEQRAKLFRPFYTTKTRGTGLGLAISRKIVEAHGGRIEVDSEPGRGTEVRFALPKEQRHGATDPGR